MALPARCKSQVETFEAGSDPIGSYALACAASGTEARRAATDPTHSRVRRLVLKHGVFYYQECLQVRSLLRPCASTDAQVSTLRAAGTEACYWPTGLVLHSRYCSLLSAYAPATRCLVLTLRTVLPGSEDQSVVEPLLARIEAKIDSVGIREAQGGTLPCSALRSDANLRAVSPSTRCWFGVYVGIGLNRTSASSRDCVLCLTCGRDALLCLDLPLALRAHVLAIPASV